MSALKYIRFLPSFLALVVLLTSTGFSMDAHYCQGELKGVSIIKKAASCHDAKEKITKCKKHKDKKLSDVEKRNCCKNYSVLLDLEEEFLNPYLQLEEENFEYHDLTTFTINSEISLDFFKEVAPYQNFKPPLPKGQIFILNQSFLL